MGHDWRVWLGGGEGGGGVHFVCKCLQGQLLLYIYNSYMNVAVHSMLTFSR